MMVLDDERPELRHVDFAGRRRDPQQKRSAEETPVMLEESRRRSHDSGS